MGETSFAMATTISLISAPSARAMRIGHCSDNLIFTPRISSAMLTIRS
jgi:hypothetical protein